MLGVEPAPCDGFVLCLVRRSQWSGAKALAKLIKPRKESSRERRPDCDKEGGKERDRAKSAPDIPLPSLPPLLPPETPPPLPQRTGSDTPDSSQLHSNHNNHIGSTGLGPQSPALTPIVRGKCTGSPYIVKCCILTYNVSYDFTFTDHRRVEQWFEVLHF